MNFYNVLKHLCLVKNARFDLKRGSQNTIQTLKMNCTTLKTFKLK